MKLQRYEALKRKGDEFEEQGKLNEWVECTDQCAELKEELEAAGIEVD